MVSPLSRVRARGAGRPHPLPLSRDGRGEHFALLSDPRRALDLACHRGVVVYDHGQVDAIAFAEAAGHGQFHAQRQERPPRDAQTADARVGRHAAGRETPLRHIVGQPESHAGRAVGSGEDVGDPVGRGLKAVADGDSARSAETTASAAARAETPAARASARRVGKVSPGVARPAQELHRFRVGSRCLECPPCTDRRSRTRRASWNRSGSGSACIWYTA